ncbi:DoxX family protein [Lysobacter sp. 5GHs7-4]|uniref:DoxX family protein n=1 Tax=Lysobacter sp. 5GHs7-4 TaxID=2904253 RepID=UPI001E63D766|nr:DoxX family protein [Lysobacter sp. 5GHs7-4]UHQ22060.1 DoxX family protein [Lysobacter sp. 5GHs7-4]
MDNRNLATTARTLMASVFIVLGLYRLLNAWSGVATPPATLAFSAVELVLGLLIASGWKLRWTAGLAALLMTVDAAMSHPFWSLAGAERGAQLLHFMKNVGLIGGLLLLIAHAGHPPRR